MALLSHRPFSVYLAKDKARGKGASSRMKYRRGLGCKIGLICINVTKVFTIIIRDFEFAIKIYFRTFVVSCVGEFAHENISYRNFHVARSRFPTYFYQHFFNRRRRRPLINVYIYIYIYIHTLSAVDVPRPTRRMII